MGVSWQRRGRSSNSSKPPLEERPRSLSFATQVSSGLFKNKLSSNLTFLLLSTVTLSGEKKKWRTYLNISKDEEHDTCNWKTDLFRSEGTRRASVKHYMHNVSEENFNRSLGKNRSLWYCLDYISFLFAFVMDR